MSDTKVKKYSLDASAILQISKMYPADRFPDLFSKVWEKLEKAADDRAVFVLDKVYNELARKDDFAHEWLLARKKSVVVICDNDVVLKAVSIVQDFPKLIDPDSEHEQADPYLIAHALINDCVVVTAETKVQNPKDPKRKKDKIPNVCEHYGVENIYPKIDGDRMIIELFEMLGFESPK